MRQRFPNVIRCSASAISRPNSGHGLRAHDQAVFFEGGDSTLHPAHCPSVARRSRALRRARPRLDHARRQAAHAGHGRVLRGRISARRRLRVSHRGRQRCQRRPVPLRIAIAGIGHDAEGVAQTVHEAYRRAECAGTYAGVTACLRSAQRAWIRAGSGIELGCGLGRAPARPQAAAVLRHGSIFGGGGRHGRTRSSSTWLASRWALRAETSVRNGRSSRCDGDEATAAANIRGDRRRARCQEDCGYRRVTALTDLLELLHNLRHSGRRREKPVRRTDGHSIMERTMGFRTATPTLSRSCSTN